MKKTLKSWGELRAASQEAASMLRQTSNGEIANRLVDAINTYCEEADREDERLQTPTPTPKAISVYCG